MQSPGKTWSPNVGGHTGTGGKKYASNKSASLRFYQSTKATPAKVNNPSQITATVAPWWVTNKGNCDAGRNSTRVYSIVSPSTLRSPSWGCFRGDSYARYPSFSSDYWRSPQSHLTTPIPSCNSDMWYHCWRLVALVARVAPSGWQISSTRLGSPVRPRRMEKGNYFALLHRESISNRLEITEALHYCQCQARSMLMCYLTGSNHTFTISAVRNRVVYTSIIDPIATLNMILQTRTWIQKTILDGVRRLSISFRLCWQVKVKVKVHTLDIAPLRSKGKASHLV